MTITLPLPDKGLSPNARIHFMAKSRITKTHRRIAFLKTFDALVLSGKTACNFMGEVSYTIDFFFPDKRRRDQDNAKASCKAYFDGIADALVADDFNFHLSELPKFSIDRANPRVEITLH